ncbi:MAG: PD-(D/E)XK nuclease domain-containing protein, partial [Lachnospiraceae bacterium]|nr:PD-(D/E)XK nuclease domain-containing protein [Lachnospiraceae bacterium]
MLGAIAGFLELLLCMMAGHVIIGNPSLGAATFLAARILSTWYLGGLGRLRHVQGSRYLSRLIPALALLAALAIMLLYPVWTGETRAGLVSFISAAVVLADYLVRSRNIRTQILSSNQTISYESVGSYRIFTNMTLYVTLALYLSMMAMFCKMLIEGGSAFHIEVYAGILLWCIFAMGAVFLSSRLVRKWYLESELTEFVGFTADEVEALCDSYSMDFKECRRWYDGYSMNGYEIYNPESVDVNVTRYLNTMDSFKNKDDIFTYLIYVGYLAYDSKTEQCRIPNSEVRREWLNAIEDEQEYEMTERIIKASKELLSETVRGNGDAVAKALDDSHIHVTSNRSYNNEDALQSAIYLAYIYALNKYTVIKEMTSGKGFADVVFIPYVPDMPAMVIELKRNDCVESAIDQIKEKKFFDSLSHYEGNILFVGINYD